MKSEVASWIVIGLLIVLPLLCILAGVSAGITCGQSGVCS